MSDRRRRNEPVLSERRAPKDDRRSAPRYPTNGTAAELAWTEADERRTVPATLIDISLGGSAAWVKTLPPRGTTVWLRLAGTNASPWHKAAVVATANLGLFRTRRMVRLRFLEACSYDFFKQAIEGFAEERVYSEASNDGLDRGSWR
jgi:hypothetical protein